MILARQRRSQCVVADLAFHVIGGKVNSEMIDIFLKNLVVIIGLASRQYFDNLSGPSDTDLPAHTVTTRYMLLKTAFIRSDM